MPGDDQRFEMVAAPSRRNPARTALRLAASGAVTMTLGAALLIGTVGLFDDSLDRANERQLERGGALEATVGAGETIDLDLDGPRVWELVALLEPGASEPQGVDANEGDEAGTEGRTPDVQTPDVRITDPQGDPVPLIDGDPTQRRFDDDITGVSIGQFRSPEAGRYRVQVAQRTAEVGSVGIGTALLPDLGDLGGAAGTFLATAAAGLLLGLGALMAVVGVGGWAWFRRARSRIVGSAPSGSN